MIELTLEQRQAVAAQGEGPPRALDPDTKMTYVLVRQEVYDRLKSLLAEEEDNQLVRDLYPQVMEVFGRDGWDDPAMDVYDDLSGSLAGRASDGMPRGPMGGPNPRR